MDLIELKQKRAEAIAKARAVLDAADNEKRSKTAEENGQIDQWMNEAKELGADIKRMENLIEEERRTAEKSFIQEEKRDIVEPQKEYRKAYWELQLAKANQQETRSIEEKLNGLLTNHRELRGNQVDIDTAGGYLVPNEFVNELIAEVDDQVFMRQLGRVFQTRGRNGITIPRKTARAGGATWTGEVTSVTEDTTLAFGAMQMKPKSLDTMVKVSRDLLRSGVMSVDMIVREDLAYDFAITQEEGFCTGAGGAEPLGVFTASDLGISTSRDLSTGNSATAVTLDNLKGQIKNLKPQYRRNAKFLFSPELALQVSQLKDGEGNYLWQSSNLLGQPDSILGYDVIESEFVPTTFTTGLYVGMFADFSKYYILDDLNLDIVVANELYIANKQVGFFGFSAVDGAPSIETAFSRIKLG